MKYSIKYSSENFYENPVSNGVFEFMVKACTNLGQLSSQHIFTNSLGEPFYFYDNMFGFETMRFRSEKWFESFSIDYSAVVEVFPKPLVFHSVLSPKDENSVLQSLDFLLENHLFLTQTPLTKIHQTAAYPRFTSDLPAFLMDLNQWVFLNIIYTKDVTTVQTTAQEILNLKKGVCQDFVHLFLGICRQQKIACRYVSGYINQGQNFFGDSFMHAWVEVLIPGGSWQGYDPTNNLLVNENYIKVCHGTDYVDCKPIKGIIYASGSQDQVYSVQVQQQQ